MRTLAHGNDIQSRHHIHPRRLRLDSEEAGHVQTQELETTGAREVTHRFLRLDALARRGWGNAALTLSESPCGGLRSYEQRRDTRATHPASGRHRDLTTPGSSSRGDHTQIPCWTFRALHRDTWIQPTSMVADIYLAHTTAAQDTRSQRHRARDVAPERPFLRRARVCKCTISDGGPTMLKQRVARMQLSLESAIAWVIERTTIDNDEAMQSMFEGQRRHCVS